MHQDKQVPDRSELRSINDELVEIYPRLCKYARSLRISKADADDLVQDTCVRILERHEQFQRGSSLEAWAITIMKNIRKDKFKRPKIFKQATPKKISKVSFSRYQESIGRKIERIDACRAIQELPEEQREVIRLKAMGYSYDEIAHKLGIPTGTVMSRLYRGRERLRPLFYG